MYKDLVERLQIDCAEFDDPICGEAAEAIIELLAALKPFASQNLSTEPHMTTLMYYTPIGELERQAREIKKRDDEILAARAVSEKF